MKTIVILIRINIQTTSDDTYLKAFGLETKLEQSKQTNVIKPPEAEWNVGFAQRALVHTADRWERILILQPPLQLRKPDVYSWRIRFLFHLLVSSLGDTFKSFTKEKKNPSSSQFLRHEHVQTNPYKHA